MHINQLRVGTTAPPTLRLGTVPVERAYLGDVLVYGEEDNPVPTYPEMVLQHAPLVYWRLNESAGAIALDSSGHGRDGVYVGTPGLGGQALLADGSGASVWFDRAEGQKASIAAAAWMNTPAVTITCLYMCSADEPPALRMLASRYHNDSGDYSWWLYIDNYELKFAYKGIGGQVTVVSSGVTAAQLGQIYYVAAHAGTSGAGIRVYSQGQLLGAATGAGYAVSSSNGSLVVAATDINAGDLYRLSGNLQEVAYFGDSLSTGDLDALATQATAPQPQWLNRTAGVAARNGTTSHTLTFPATSAGSFLVVIVSGAVTSTATTPGWTKRLSTVGDAETAVFTRTASAGDTTLTLTHNGSNYPINYVVYEFPAGTTWIDGAGGETGPVPDLTLPGTPVTVFAGFGIDCDSPSNPAASTQWGWGWFEDMDTMTPHNGATDGVYTTIGWLPVMSATSVSPATAGFYGPVYAVTNSFNNNYASVIFALSMP